MVYSMIGVCQWVRDASEPLEKRNVDGMEEWLMKAKFEPTEAIVNKFCEFIDRDTLMRLVHGT